MYNMQEKFERHPSQKMYKMQFAKDTQKLQ